LEFIRGFKVRFFWNQICNFQNYFANHLPNVTTVSDQAWLGDFFPKEPNIFKLE
jgi:hypothetical protein